MDEEGEDGLCLAKKTCDSDDTSPQYARLAKCSHCGAKQWNILGDSDTGYVLAEGDGKTCLVREKATNKAMTALCDSSDVPYTPFQLQFATANDIKTMGSPAARLIGAASDGDLTAVQQLLEDVDVNVKDWDDLTAIIPAASSGNIDIVKLLVKKGADVNARDKDGITALMEASIMGHVDVVKELLEESALVDSQANSRVTALWLASGEGKADVLKHLLEAGADATNTRVDGITALMTASVGGHTDAVGLLLEHGADPRAVDKDGLTPLMNAAENGTVPVLKLLAQAGAKTDEEHQDKYVDIMSSTGFNALIIASAHGHVEAIRYLIKVANVDINSLHENQVTALMYAAASGHVDAMKVLIEEGKVDVNQLHSNGGSALLEASTAGAGEAIKVLLEHGAKDDLVDEDGVTPVMAVASQGHLDGMDSILDSLKKHLSADEYKDHINLASFSGGTSVMFAAAGGHTNCTKALIDEGAEINAIARATPDYLKKLKKMIEEGTVPNDDPHVDGVTAVHVAAQGGHLDCVQLLITAGAKVSIADDEGRTPLALAIKGNYGEVASLLVESGADPNTPYIDESKESHNLLMDSMIVENEEFAKLLVEKGADIYYKDANLVSTLLQASHRGMIDVVKALLAKHESATTTETEYLDAASDEGITPLIAASSEGHVDIVKLLVDAKANIDAKDKDGTNSLMAAAARGHKDICAVLLAAGAQVNEQNVDGHTALMFAYNGKNQVETLWARYTQYLSEAAATSSAVADGDDAGTGSTIKEALDNHTALVDMLMGANADVSLKDREGHVAKDFDYNPNADGEVLEQAKSAQAARDGSKEEL